MPRASPPAVLPHRLRTLGTLDLRDAAGVERRAVLAQPKRLALLAYLALAVPRGPRRRDTLLAMFWPELDAPRGRNALSQALHVLRRELGDDALPGTGAELVGVDDARLVTDVAELRAALQEGALDRAVAAYGGELLPGLHVDDAPDFERWLDGERAALRTLAAEAATTLATRAREAGEQSGAVAWARRAVAIAPDDERALRALLLSLDAAGERAEALRAFEAHARRLREELELEPEPATLALVRALRDGARATPAPVALAARVSAPGVPAAAEEADALVASTETVAPPRRPRRPATLLALAATGLLVLLGVTAGRRWRLGDAGTGARETSGATSPTVVAVMPFAIDGAPTRAYLRDALVTLLGTQLDELAQLRSTDPRATLQLLARTGDSVPSLERARAAARALGAGRFVMGEVVPVGAELRIRASLYDVARAAPLAVASAQGRDETLLATVDRLAAELTAGALPGSSARIATTASLTTNSLPALEAFLDGEAHLRAGRYTAAGFRFRDATRLDSTFALAHYRFAITADWLNIGPEVPALAAHRWRARLGQHDRWLVEAYAEYIGRNAPDAERFYRLITETYPTDVEAWRLLGEVQFHYGPLRGVPADSAAGAFRRALALEPDNYEALLHLARLAARARDRVAFDSLAARARRSVPGHDRNVELDALAAFSGGDSVARAAVMRRLGTLPEWMVDLVAKGILAYTPAPGDAAPVVAMIARQQYDQTWTGRAHALLATVEAARGRWRAAAVLLDSTTLRTPALGLAQGGLLALVPDAPPAFVRDVRARVARDGGARLGRAQWLYLSAALDARLGALDAADAAVARLAASPRGADSVAHDDYLRSARAHVAAARGDWAKVVQLMPPSRLDVQGPTAAAMHAARAPERLLMAEGLARTGRRAEAIEWLATFPEPGGYDAAWIGAAWSRRAELLSSGGAEDEAMRVRRELAALRAESDGR